MVLSLLHQPDVALRADKKNDATRNDEGVARLIEMGFSAADARNVFFF